MKYNKQGFPENWNQMTEEEKQRFIWSNNPYEDGVVWDCSIWRYILYPLLGMVVIQGIICYIALYK